MASELAYEEDSDKVEDPRMRGERSSGTDGAGWTTIGSLRSHWEGVTVSVAIGAFD